MLLKRLKVLLLATALLLVAQSSQALQVGDKAPDFSLPATTGTVKLSDFVGKKNLVVFFYIGAFTNLWTQEALAFQLDLPKFEAENTQVLGVSVDFNDTNRAWADKLGLTYPLLSDAQRKMATAYETLNENAALIKTPGVAAYLRSKRAWFVIDKLGVIRYMKIESPSLIPGDELLDVVKKFH